MKEFLILLMYSVVGIGIDGFFTDVIHGEKMDLRKKQWHLRTWADYS